MRAILLCATLLVATAATAADNLLLIQLQPGGAYTVWHTEGESQLSDDEAMNLEVAAKPEGGAEMQTSAGPARAFETSSGVVIRLPGAPRDKAVMIDRDACGHVRLWHAAGANNPTEEQITDIYLSAVPEGGKRLTIGDSYVKAFATPLGVTATFWKIPVKPGR